MHTVGGRGGACRTGARLGTPVLRDPHPGALQVARLTAALPFQGRAGR